MATLTSYIIKFSAIEGEILDAQEVRLSIALQLGIDITGLKPVRHHIDGIVEMMSDASQHSSNPLTADRLFGCLFIGFSWRQKFEQRGRYSGMPSEGRPLKPLNTFKHYNIESAQDNNPAARKKNPHEKKGKAVKPPPTKAKNKTKMIAKKKVVDLSRLSDQT